MAVGQIQSTDTVKHQLCNANKGKLR